MSTDRTTAVEKSPSRIQANKQLELLSSDFSASLGASEAELLPIITRSFTEQVGSEIFFRPNALPYLYRARQLEGKLSQDSRELKTQLGNTWLMIVDIANLKKINELPGSSHSTGDQVIGLHTRSVIESTEEDESSHCLVRFMGDEFADFFNDPKHRYTPEEIDQLVAKKTAYLLEQAKSSPTHLLNNLANNHPDLIGKVVQYVRLSDIKVPTNFQRVDDMVEVMFEAAEKNSANKPQSALTTDKQILKTIGSWGLESPDAGSLEPTISAIDTIIKSIGATDLTIPLSERVIKKNEERRQVIEQHLPNSISATWKRLIENASNDPQKTARIIGLFEESLFNNQFSRTPPILNDWVFDELANSTDSPFTTLQMTSVPFAKLSNSIWGRIATTNLLKHAAKKTLELLGNNTNDSGDGLEYIVKKQGASFYILSTAEKSSDLRVKLKENRKDVVQKIANSKTLKEFFYHARDLLFYTPATISLGNKDKNYGEQMDGLRNTHYLGEIAHILRACREYNNQNVYNLLLYFISERSSDRLDKLSNQAGFSGLSPVMGVLAKQSPQPRPPSSSA